MPADVLRDGTRPAPILVICLGLQLALDESEEDGRPSRRARPRPRAAVRSRSSASRASLGSGRAVGRGPYWFATRTNCEPIRRWPRARGTPPSSITCASVGVQFHPEKTALPPTFLERCLFRALIPRLDVAVGRVVKACASASCSRRRRSGRARRRVLGRRCGRARLPRIFRDVTSSGCRVAVAARVGPST